MYCSKYFTVFEYLVWTSHEIKKVVAILAKPAPEKGKTITTVTLNLVTNVYEDDNLSRYVHEKKDYVSASKVVHKKNLQLAKVFVTCKNYILLSKKHTQM